GTRSSGFNKTSREPKFLPRGDTFRQVRELDPQRSPCERTNKQSSPVPRVSPFCQRSRPRFHETPSAPRLDIVVARSQRELFIVLGIRREPAVDENRQVLAQGLDGLLIWKLEPEPKSVPETTKFAPNYSPKNRGRRQLRRSRTG